MPELVFFSFLGYFLLKTIIKIPHSITSMGLVESHTASQTQKLHSLSLSVYNLSLILK